MYKILIWRILGGLSNKVSIQVAIKTSSTVYTQLMVIQLYNVTAWLYILPVILL